MAGKALIIAGAILLSAASLMFVMDLLSLHSYLLYALSGLAFFGSVMAGKRLGAYVHDLHMAKERGYSFGPAMFIYMWLFFFVLFLIIYTVAKLALGYFVKLLFLPFGGAYMPIIYNFLALGASYLLFSGIYSGKEKFITAWGKMSESMQRTTKAVPSAMSRVPAEGAKKGMELMNAGMDTMKKFKKN